MANHRFLSPAEFLDHPECHASWSLEESASYTRWLATGHYENFHVVSLLLPRDLHQDFYNVYAYCRWSDDLGDEMGSPARSLEMLSWWRGELESMYRGDKPTHPVFLALQQTVRRRHLPIKPFADLLDAFVQDQSVTRYEDWPQLEDYCRNSANPVGRLVLMLCGYTDEVRLQLSDAICTGLQLANFWQDVSVDLDKDRIYLPLTLLHAHGCTETQLLAREDSPGVRAAVREAVAYAHHFFRAGKPLVPTLNRRLALDIDLFIRGGVAILHKVEAMDCAVLNKRPRIGKLERVALLAKALGSHLPRLFSAPVPPQPVQRIESARLSAPHDRR